MCWGADWFVWFGRWVDGRWICWVELGAAGSQCGVVDPFGVPTVGDGVATGSALTRARAGVVRTGFISVPLGCSSAGDWPRVWPGA